MTCEFYFNLITEAFDGARVFKNVFQNVLLVCFTFNLVFTQFDNPFGWPIPSRHRKYADIEENLEANELLGHVFDIYQNYFPNLHYEFIPVNYLNKITAFNVPFKARKKNEGLDVVNLSDFNTSTKQIVTPQVIS